MLDFIDKEINWSDHWDHGWYPLLKSSKGIWKHFPQPHMVHLIAILYDKRAIKHLIEESKALTLQYRKCCRDISWPTSFLSTAMQTLCLLFYLSTVLFTKAYSGSYVWYNFSNCNDTGIWIPSLWKTRTCLSCVVCTVVADGLVTHGAGLSALSIHDIDLVCSE